MRGSLFKLYQRTTLCFLSDSFVKNVFMACGSDLNDKKIHKNYVFKETETRLKLIRYKDQTNFPSDEGIRKLADKNSNKVRDQRHNNVFGLLVKYFTKMVR